MGYAHVFWIYEDDLRDLQFRDGGDKLIGERVLMIFKRGGDGYDHENFPGSSPGLCRIGRFHSGDFVPLIWSRNCLLLLGQLRQGEVDELLRLLQTRKREPAQTGKAASTLWRMLTCPLGDLDAFGHRVLLTLFRSPMTAVTWELAGSPASFSDLANALTVPSEWVYSFLYDYLAWFEKTSQILGPPEGEDETHLLELSDLLVEHIPNDNRLRQQLEGVLCILADHVANGSRFVNLREFFAQCIPEDKREDFRRKFNETPGKAVRLLKLRNRLGIG